MRDWDTWRFFFGWGALFLPVSGGDTVMKGGEREERESDALHFFIRIMLCFCFVLVPFILFF